MIGDPSGKSNERNLLDEATLNHNVEGIKSVLSRFLDFDAKDENAPILVNNYDWMKDFSFIDFARDIGKRITVNYMMSKDSVKKRLSGEEGAEGMSFTEFTYQLIQGYDFYHLHKHYHCVLQLGGSDQWGNIVNGIDLTRRVLDREIYGLTSPLLTTSDGKKMGKSASGAVWLRGDMLSPYEFWQFWRNTTDADVGRFLKLYTDLPVEECDRLGGLAGSEINGAKIILAREVTTLLHGAEAAEAAEATAREVFEKGGVGADLPTVTLTIADLMEGITAAQLFVKAGLSPSGKEAKRLIAEGGAKVNDEIVTDTALRYGASHLVEPMKLTAGKKRHALVVLG